MGSWYRYTRIGILDDGVGGGESNEAYVIRSASMPPRVATEGAYSSDLSKS